jgi:hypothetical protein
MVTFAPCNSAESRGNDEFHFNFRLCCLISDERWWHWGGKGGSAAVAAVGPFVGAAVAAQGPENVGCCGRFRCCVAGGCPAPRCGRTHQSKMALPASYAVAQELIPSRRTIYPVALYRTTLNTAPLYCRRRACITSAYHTTRHTPGPLHTTPHHPTLHATSHHS